MRGLSLVAASGGHSSSRCAGLSLSQPLLLRSTSSRRAGSVVVAHGPSCSAACGILPDQGLNLRPPHWQADSQPLRHQGSPPCRLLEDLILRALTLDGNLKAVLQPELILPPHRHPSPPGLTVLPFGESPKLSRACTYNLTARKYITNLKWHF